VFLLIDEIVHIAEEYLVSGIMAKVAHILHIHIRQYCTYSSNIDMVNSAEFLIEVANFPGCCIPNGLFSARFGIGSPI
jgi:hypothetical protein